LNNAVLTHCAPDVQATTFPYRPPNTARNFKRSRACALAMMHDSFAVEGKGLSKVNAPPLKNPLNLALGSIR
jgi:hypothetical protein